MASSDEIREKERRVREFIGAKGLKALLFKRQANFSWMTGGGLNLVGITTEMGVAALLITANSKFVVCSNIEAPRMAREEKLEEQGYAVVSCPWHEDSETALIKKLAGGGKIGCDAGFPEAEVLAEDIARLRYSLTPQEVERYRWLGERVSMGLEKTVMETAAGKRSRKSWHGSAASSGKTASIRSRSCRLPTTGCRTSGTPSPRSGKSKNISWSR